MLSDFQIRMLKNDVAQNALKYLRTGTIPYNIKINHQN